MAPHIAANILDAAPEETRVVQTDLRTADAATSLPTTDMTANLDRLAARALVMSRSTGPTLWSEATKDRLYRRMFPDDLAT